MRSCSRQLLIGLGVIAVVTLTGCTGSLHIPISEQSHFRFEATPTEDRLEISYHRYEKQEPHSYNEQWVTTVEFEWLGVVYDSEKDHSPAARSVELGWEKLWEDGTPDWNTIVRLLEDKELEAAYRESKRESSPERRTFKLPSEDDALLIRHQNLADLHLFMFATPAGW